MQLLLVIFFGVFGGYVFYSAMRRMRQKKNRAQFDQTILDNMNANRYYSNDATYPQHLNVGSEDPLLHDFAEKPASVSQKSQPPHIAQQSDHNTEAAEMPAPQQAAQTKPLPEVIVFTILPEKNMSISGQHLMTMLKKHLFFFGKQKIFHRHLSDINSPVLFSAVSLTEPGYFDEAQMPSQIFQGIALFMQVSDLQAPLAVFEKMLTTARQLAATLNAQLCDARRAPLSATAIQQYRELIQAYSFENQVSAAQG